MTHPILFVHSSNELYGSDMILLNLVRHLDRDTFRPLVVMPEDIPYEGLLSQALTEAGVENTTADMAVLRRRYVSPRGLLAFGRRLVQGTRALRTLMQQQGTVLVHTQTGAVWSGGLASRWMGVPHVFYIMEIVQRPALTRRLMAWFIHHFSSRVVVISQAVGDHLIEDQPGIRQKLVVIPPGIDPERFHPRNEGGALRQEWGIPQDAVLFGVVGRIHWWKGQDVFLRAAAQVATRIPHARFILVGDVVPGEEWRRDALKEEIARMGIGDRVVWAGYRRDVPRVMAALDVLVLPSTEPEPFGRVIVEAMATGRPVIATAHGGPLETVVHEETGLHVPPGDVDALARAMVRLATQAELRQRMGAAARRRVLAEYTLERHVQRFQSLYEEMLASHLPGAT